ncbi:MAG: DUF6781 family protein [Pseudomonadota bacterium]|nr:DUF6781 family protein [Pseudomonadota bacterium]
MSENERSNIDTGAARAQAEASMETGQDIFQRVRDITLEALTSGQVDTDSIRQVVGAVTEGVSAGAAKHSDEARETLDQAVKGMDDAMQKTAGATRLAIEEAAGKVEEFTEQDLKSAVKDLQDLESIFLDTLTDVAKKGGDMASEILGDLAGHARNTGTGVGEQVGGSVVELQEKVSRAAEEGLRSGAEATRGAAEQIARAASGFLTGLADSLQQSGKSEDESGRNG